MTIIHGKTVAITYTLTLENGQVVDSNVDDTPLTYVQGEEQLIFGLEQALAGKDGRRDAQSLHSTGRRLWRLFPRMPIIDVPLEHLPVGGPHQPGAMITAVGPQGQELEGMVTAINDAERHWSISTIP